MNFPTTFEEFFASQRLRKSALKSQLLALQAQARTIKSLDAEHAMAIEGSTECEIVFNHARDLVASAEAIAERANTASKDTTVKSLRALRETSIQLINRARSLDKQGLERAKMRLDQCLSEHEGVTPQSVSGRVPAETGALAVKAGVTCYQAETEQFGTFALQIEALCHLACEFAYNSALDAPAFKETKIS